MGKTKTITLREARKAAGLTIAELAQKSGVGWSAIHAIEGGRMPGGPERAAAAVRCPGRPLRAAVAGQHGGYPGGRRGGEREAEAGRPEKRKGRKRK